MWPARRCSSTTGATLEVITALPAIRAAQIFVATLGASSYTYAEANASAAQLDWLAHRAFAYFGGVAAQVVPDNLKSGVVKAWYDPEINRTYAGMAAHYDTGSCRHGGKPPKANSEVSVHIASAKARLRNRPSASPN